MIPIVGVVVSRISETGYPRPGLHYWLSEIHVTFNVTFEREFVNLSVNINVFRGYITMLL